jgi:hypothetical protein
MKMKSRTYYFWLGMAGSKGQTQIRVYKRSEMLGMQIILYWC